MKVIGVELHLPKRSALPGLAVFLAIGIVHGTIRLSPKFEDG